MAVRRLAQEFGIGLDGHPLDGSVGRDGVGGHLDGAGPGDDLEIAFAALQADVDMERRPGAVHFDEVVVPDPVHADIPVRPGVRAVEGDPGRLVDAQDEPGVAAGRAETAARLGDRLVEDLPVDVEVNVVPSKAPFQGNGGTLAWV